MDFLEVEHSVWCLKKSIMHQTEMKLVIVTQAFIMINWSGFAVPPKKLEITVPYSALILGL